MFLYCNNMQYDCFTISRYVFLAFLIIIAIYFVVENKQAVKRVEKFEEAKPAADASGNKSASATAAAGSTQAEKADAPTGGSKELLTDKNSQSSCVACEKKPEATLPKSDDEGIKKEITSIYKELYQTEPTEDEMAFYLDYAKNRNITKDALREVIATSAPTLRKTLPNRARDMTPVGTERQVIVAYNEILARNPSREELFQFSHMLHDDKTFTIDKLKQVLLTSEEYMRMEKTQTNMAFTSLRGEVTERQLTMLVYQLYKEVAKKEYIDEDTLRFLKKKYTEFNLNDELMKDFIAKYIANQPFDPSKLQGGDAAAQAKKDAAAGDAKKQLSQEEIDAMKKSIREEIMKELAESQKKTADGEGNTSANASTKESFSDFQGKNYITDSVLIFGDRPNADVLQSLSRNATSSSGKVDTNKIVDNIKAQGACSYFKDKNESELLASGQKQLADYIESRNRSHLKNVCERNSTFLNADDDMVLFPEFKWEVPMKAPPVCVGRTGQVNPLMDQTSLIGTLLTDAEETNVGSILPVKPPV